MVKYGDIQSCGCLRKETTAETRFINHTGKRYGRLLVLGFLPEKNKHGHTQWSCLCDCGNHTMTTTLNKTKSCGCIRSELASARCSAMKQENPISKTKAYKNKQHAIKRKDPLHAMAEKISLSITRAMKSLGSAKHGPTFSLIGYSKLDLKSHIEKQFLPTMTWENRDQWEIDHITPISTATCHEDVIALNQLPNLRPMWAVDNNKKRAQRHFLI